jgi:alpha-L-arabinofuranosidase
MTVGNEEYGSWEVDNHSSQHNGATYAATVTGTSGYYSLVKAASPSTLVGVDVEPNYAPWDQDVMSGAKGSYDFVEYHYYPETPGEESDTFITQQAAQELTTNINTIKSELTKWGTPNTPIYVGEIGGAYSNPGKQSWSITQGLYAGQVLGEMMNDGVSRLTWWIGFGNCNGQAGNDSSSLYGWQTFGAYNVFSDGPSDTTCPNAGPIGTMSPTARAFQLFSNVAVNGESVLTPTVAGDTTDVRAYAATNSGGTALVLFNLNETTPQSVLVTLTGKTSSTSVNVTTYDKSIYDQSQNDAWDPPTTTSLGAQNLPLTLTLTPWSMNVVIIK